MITQEYVKSLFEYHEGRLFWKETNENKRVAGKPAGWLDQGYYRVKIDGKSYKHSRLVFLYHKGYLPDIVDHKDRDTLNDLIDNLRAADNSSNQCNKKVLPSNKLGLKNIRAKGSKFQVRVTKDGKQVSKTLKSIEEAIAWRDKKLLELHGEYARFT